MAGLPFGAGYVRRVVGLGDSIIFGVGDDAPDFGFRGPLYDLEKAAGRPFFMLGSSSSGSVGHPDPYTDGQPGWTISQLSGIVSSRSSLYEPDITILQIGTNDLASGRSATQVRDDLSALLDQVYTNNPKRWHQIVFLNILRRLDSFNSAVIQTNALLPAMVAAKSYASQVTLIDWYNALADSDYNVDQLHPNHAGYVKLASFIDANGFAQVLTL